MCINNHNVQDLASFLHYKAIFLPSRLISTARCFVPPFLSLNFRFCFSKRFKVFFDVYNNTKLEVKFKIFTSRIVHSSARLENTLKNSM
jgi:hypothetical protein